MFRFRKGAHVPKGANAELVGAELERLKDGCGGKIGAADVVNAARKKSNPLHGFFTWDNTEAAEQWRLHQARMLLCFIVRVEPDPKGGEIETRHFVVVEREDDGRSYESVVDVMADSERRELLLAQALEDIETWREKYDGIKALAGIFEAIDAVTTKARSRRKNRQPQVATA